jgi:hypothetical protein
MVGGYAVDHLGNLKHICAMEYEPQDKPIRTDVGSRHTGAKVPPEKRAEIEKRLKEGEGIVAIAKTVGSSEHTVSAIRNDLGGTLELNAWKKGHRNNLMQAAAKMGQRLVNEVDNLPVGQLPLAIAILTDKAMTLNDQPTHITENRLRISHDNLSAMLNGEVIDVSQQNENPEEPKSLGEP